MDQRHYDDRSLEHQTHTLQQQIHAVERRLRWWRGLGCGFLLLGLLSLALPLSKAAQVQPRPEVQPRPIDPRQGQPRPVDLRAIAPRVDSLGGTLEETFRQLDQRSRDAITQRIDQQFGVRAARDLAAQIAADSSRAMTANVRFLKDILTDALSRLDEPSRNAIVQRINNQFGVDIGNDTAVGPGIAYRPKFALETYDSCVEDACNSAGGKWQDSGPWGRGCYYPEGASVAEKAAITTAFVAYTQECWWKLVASPVRAIIGWFF